MVIGPWVQRARPIGPNDSVVGGILSIIDLVLKPIAGLTLRTRHDAELALSILAKAGVAVKAAEPEFRDIAVEVLSELEGDDPPWDI